MSAAPQVVVAGHVCIDVIPRLDGPVDLSPGALTRVGPAALSGGGAVANTGVALHRLGVPVRLVGRVGDDLFGGALLDVLRAHDPALADAMVVAPGEATSYSLVISPPGVDRSFLHCPGANDTFTARDVRVERLRGARLLHFGYPPIMRRMCEDDGAELRRMFAAVHAAGMLTSLDLCRPDPRSAAGALDWEALLAATLPHVDVFAPSADELLYMLDRPLHDALEAGAAPASIIDGALLRGLAERLLALGPALVAIKLGDRGLYLRTAAGAERIASFCAPLELDAAAWRDCEVLSPCFVPRRVAGTTGSGDCTIAGLLAALLRGEGPERAATSATAVGACSVEQPGATDGIVPWAQVAERVAGGWPRAPVGPGFHAIRLTEHAAT